MTSKKKIKNKNISSKIKNRKKIKIKGEKKYEKILRGVVDHVNEDIAYIVCEKLNNDILVQKNNLKNALHGDFVEIFIKSYRGKKSFGVVSKIIERSKKLKICTLSEKKYIAKPAEKKLYTEIVLENADEFNLSEKSKFGVEITSWDKKNNLPRGKIKKKLGDIGDNEAEINSLILEYDLPENFSEDVLAESKESVKLFSKEEIEKRRDFRDEITFTIDPKDAKDFDDALSVKKTSNGKIEIGIHIADVSFFVKENSKIDKEAYKRGCTVYLVDKTIPMLPENLCNNICSLVPKKERLTYSVVVEMNKNFEIENVWFGETVIKSKHRFTYEDAEKILEEKKGIFYEELSLLQSISKNLKEKRENNGAINFVTKEVYFKVNEKKEVISIEQKKSLSTHSLIEELMVLANNLVASFIKKVSKKGDKAPFRIHAYPEEAKLLEFFNFAKTVSGIENFPQKSNNAEKINFILKKIKETPQEFLVNSVAIRSMAKAIYFQKSEGHYGLGLDDYTHFTSPIRRYPDLMVHRVLKNLEQKIDRQLLEKKCKYLTEREVIATNAERASLKFKQVEFAKKFFGKNFEGQIIGFSEKNIFVELENNIEGAMELNAIQGDNYKFIKKFHCVVGKKLGRKYCIGDFLKVSIKEIDSLKRQIYLQIER